MEFIDEKEKFIEKIYYKILTKTGLEEELLIWYNALIEEHNTTDKIILPKDIKENMLEKILIMENIPQTDINKIIKLNTYLDSKLPQILNILEKKKLIEYRIIETGEICPRLIGYNYLEDPEFYIAYKKKNRTKWEGRIPKIIELETILKYIQKGYEFEDSTFISKLLN